MSTLNREPSSHPTTRLWKGATALVVAGAIACTNVPVHAAQTTPVRKAVPVPSAPAKKAPVGLSQELQDFLDLLSQGVGLTKEIARRGLRLLKEVAFDQLDIASKRRLESLEKDLRHFLELDEARQEARKLRDQLTDRKLAALTKRIEDLEREVRRLALEPERRPRF